MKKVFFLLMFAFILTSTIAQNRPNVIFILADDIGVGDISKYRKIHSKNIILETPTIDKLASEGVLFTDAHSPAALCAPTRYAIMTGNHCYRSYAPRGVWGSYQESPISSTDITLGQLMKQAGYNTSFFGKWGFGMDFTRKDDANTIYRGPRHKPELDVDITKVVDKGPVQNGFDYSFMYPAGIQAAPYAVYENGEMYPLHRKSKIVQITQKNMDKIGFKLDKMEGLGDSHWNPFNAGDLLVNKAVDFIKQKSNKEKPFFMYYCTQAVHKPHTPTKKLNGVKIAGTTPSNHLDMVKELDVQMSMIVSALKKKGVYENTLIIFTSDNGGLQIGKTIKSGHKSNSVYRGGKNQAWEGGNKVPFIAHWPGKIKPGVNNDAILGIDIMATLAALTNQKLKEKEAMDSSNLLPILLSKKEIKPHPFLITQAGTGAENMIIKDGWKLILKFKDNAKSQENQKLVALFNLTDNPSENDKKNLIKHPKHQNKVDELLVLYNKTRMSKVNTGIK
ncbi:sulfatase family protein [Polaribacter sp. SA4-12]|uniref:sulfatase family protein n=1 Tax=Polaribacter sp. SA4-12 TaxID=1312072 RepID=UPI000B581363|nr:arylsulfatase [Polaribacter sp. SA4-12]ARV16592.1 sulfatase [Polaribacter sp. SA4-12]